MPQPRPEFENPPEVFYNAREAQRYTVSTRVRTIQRQMTLRALELMNLPQPTAETAGLNQSAFLLDIGCGSGLSGAVLTDEGHAWVGVDISGDMLRLAKEDELHYYHVPLRQQKAPAEEEDFLKHRKKVDLSNVQWGLVDSEPHSSAAEEEEGEENEEAEAEEGPLRRPTGPEMVEVAHSDMGQGLPFRPGTFDGCVSISAIQWLCHVSKKGEVPQRRLMALFQSLYNCLRRGAKAVLQFFPSTPDQVHMITRAAMKCGFSGGVVVDYPNSSKAKKHYLVLQAGQVAGGFVPPPGLTGEVTDEDEEEEEEEDEGEEYSEDDGEEGRTQVRVAGRDRERVKRSRAHSSHQQKNKRRRKDNRPVTGTKDWVLLKKDERRRRGEKVSADSKYTMRRRKPRF